MKINKLLMQDVSWNKLEEKFNELIQKYRITRYIKKFTESHSTALRVCLTICFALIVFWQSWTCDDAYHSYIMARHLAEGKGLVYNVGYRVTASTCPLLTLIQAGIYKVIPSMVATGIIIGVASSGAAAAVLFFKFCTKFRYAIFAFLAMILSYSFMSFTTSGLENSLLFLLGSLFLSRFFLKDDFDAKDLYVMALLLALLAIARMDTVLIFIPMIVTAYLFMTKVKFAKRVGIGFLGLLPFILWEAFAVFYYGFPFPNTFYAKLFAGYPQSEYIIKGLTYLNISFMFDCLLILIPSLFMFLIFRSRSKKGALIFTGLLLYTVYVVRIGGDFMVGRHLTLNFFLAICGVCTLLSELRSANDKNINCNTNILWLHPGLLATCSLCLAVILSSNLRSNASEQFFTIANYSNIVNFELSDTADEKLYYGVYLGTSTLKMIDIMTTGQPDGMRILSSNVFDQIESAIEKRMHGLIIMYQKNWKDVIYGYVAYQIADETDIYLSDSIGLMDPLLSHVPGINCKYWRIGHIVRVIPDGYIETIETGENRIVDPSLHKYYDKMLSIVRGDLFDKERLKLIWSMNTGRYDYLLEDYKATMKKQYSASH